MNKYEKWLSGVLLLMGITACTDDVLSNQQDMSAVLEGKNVVTVQVPGVDSRVEFDVTGSNIQVKWKESGEEFTLFTNNPNFDDTKPAQGPDNFQYKNYTYTQFSDNKFIGDATLIVGNTIFAYYPCVGTYWNFMNAVPFQLGGQTGELDSKLTYMYISDVNVDNVDVLQFKHLTSLMKATFKVDDVDITSTIKQLRLFLPDGTYTDNYVDLTVSPIAYTYSAGSNEITIKTEKQLAQFYIYLPFGIEEKEEISFIAYDEEFFYTGSLTATRDIETGKIYPIDVKLTAQGTYLWKPGTAVSTNVLGEGTSANPYLIKTANDLQWMIEDAAKNEDKYYKLENDFTIRSSESNPWIPIGSASNPFKGVLDGNNKAINGTITAGNSVRSVSSASDVFGFFGYIGVGGEVKNLWINAEVVGNTAPETFTGGLAGYNEGRISNSRSNKSVVGGASTTGKSYTGGIVGYNSGSLEGCTGSGEVKGTTSCKTVAYTGGVVGYNVGSLNGCNAYGTITAAQAEQETVVGGIVGFNDNTGTISGAKQNYFSVLGANSPHNYIGGVVGINKGQVDNCLVGTSMSIPTSNNIETCYLGGLVAKNDGGTVTNSGCNNGTTVKGVKAKTIYVGGYVAYNSGTLQNLYCYDGTVIGGEGDVISYTGGAVAYNDGVLSQTPIHYKTTGGSAPNGTSITGSMVGINGENGKLYDVYTQVRSAITAGTGLTIYTGVYAGKNSGIIYPCCNDGGSLSNDTMPLIGSGNSPVDWDENTGTCPCPIHSVNNQ